MGFHNFESVDVDNIYTPVQGEVYNPLMLEGVAKHIKQLARCLIKGSGCSYEVYLAKLSGEIDRLLATAGDHALRATILYVAQEHDYHSKEEIVEMQEAWGLCHHGLDPDCCPLGCGG